ncbi:MAG: MBL fold metallo-hydrolase [Chloroflexi bacterium]|nr:MBL fold metallo-hydrolase [Chloroflexota bacterium]
MEPLPSAKVADDLFIIDTAAYGRPRFLASYIIAGDKIALVDCGPTTCLPRLKTEVKRLGFNVRDIDYIIITHIHLDHYGGAGSLLEDLPRGKVVMHQRGARHAINPGPMLERTRAMVGDEAMAREGPILPIPAERLMAVEDGDVLDLGKGHRLQVLHTPGHTNSSICLLDEKLKGLFVGDILGPCFTADDVTVPLAPSGDFDVDMSIKSIQRMQGIKAELLVFPHFGVSRKADKVMKHSVKGLTEWSELAREALRQGPDKVLPVLNERAKRDMAAIRDKGPYYHYILDEAVPLSAAGYTRYFQRRGQG